MQDTLKLLFILTVAISILACQNQSTIKSERKLTYSNYINELPQINLPYSFKCNEPFVRPGEINYEDTLVKKYKPEFAGIIGKVYQNDQSIGILYTYAADVMLPVLIITDTSGVNLDGIELYELGNCLYGASGPDNEYSSIISGQITKDLHVFTLLEEITCDTIRCDTIRKQMKKKISPSGKVQLAQ
jgi:hypothetical protein